MKQFFAKRCNGRRGGAGNNGMSCGKARLSEKNGRGPMRVCEINGNRTHCARLASMGVYPGSEIELLCPARGDTCLIRVHGGTISLDRCTSDNIVVTD